ARMNSTPPGAPGNRAPEQLVASLWQEAFGAQGGAADDHVYIRVVLHVLRRRWPVILGTVATIVLATGIVLLQLTPRYGANAALVLDGPKSTVVNIQAVTDGLPVDAGIVQSENRRAALALAGRPCRRPAASGERSGAEPAAGQDLVLRG